MVINEPTEFKVRKQVTRKGNKVMEWVEMRKGAAYLFRYRDVSLRANRRYLDALTVVDDPTEAIRTLDHITTRKQVAPKRTAKAFNPVARDENQLFHALLRRVKRWNGGDHVQRWAATALLQAEKGFRKVKGFRDMDVLVRVLSRKTSDQKKVVA